MKKGRIDLAMLVAKVEALKASDQLRLAAGLIDEGQLDTAEVLLERVSNAIRLRRLFPKAYDATLKPAPRYVAKGGDQG